LACRRAWNAGAGRDLVRVLLGLGLAGLSSVLAFAPQMIAWRCVYGHWLVTPMALSHNWLRPSLWGVLLSQDRSLFYWTPLCLLACAGFLTFLSRGRCAAVSGAVPADMGRDAAAALLAVAFVV